MTEGRLRVIDGGVPIEKPKRKRKPRTPTAWKCRTCTAEDGRDLGVLMKVKVGAFEDGQLRLSGGRDAYVCAICLMKGRLTFQTS